MNLDVGGIMTAEVLVNYVGLDEERLHRFLDETEKVHKRRFG